MRTYVATFGYYTTPVTRPVLNEGIGEGDEVVLLRPDDDEEDDRADTAVGDIEQLLSEVAPSISVTVEQLPYHDFDGMVRECLAVLRAATDHDGETVLIFGGGAREMFLPLSAAALVYADRIDLALQFGDVDEKVRELTLPEFATPVPDPAIGTLELVASLDGETTLPELAEEGDRSKSSVGRHLDHLEAVGAVETEVRDRTRHVRLTLGGQLRLDARR